MISLSNVSKFFGENRAVRNLTLEVRPGEIFAFLGPNGAGKTTTIKMIVGLLQPTGGSIRVCGYDMDTEGLLAKESLSYVPDQPYLYEKLTGREFLHFIADIYRLEPDVGEFKVTQAAGLFDLEEFADQLAENYSHGMKQRVVMAAALLHDPRVIVIDEPMVGLDPKSARLLKNILQQKARDGACIFMSTHTLSVAEEIADRVGIIDRGDLVALGTIDELTDRAQVEGRLEDVFLAITEEASV
ncbi:MAG: ABC transporter ATP-binding protein [Planctomycetota bacterium]|jgi:ABC-2 type transport system ATP-binding protein